MKSYTVAVIALLGLSAVLGARPKSEQVLEEVDKLRPRYQEIQDYVIHTISDTRLESSEKLGKFNSDILLVKTTFVLDAIKKENALLYQVENQPSTVDQSCLSFVKILSESVINLAGTGFSSCIAETSDILDAKINDFYSALQQDEKDYVGLGLLNVFKGENIFHNPDAILAKLQARALDLEGYPTYLKDDLGKLIDSLSGDLEALQLHYIVCMTDSEQRLRDGFILAYSHLELTCKAVTVPAANVPEIDVVEPSEPQSLEVSWPNTEAVRRLRERFGL
ncbi:uncharacterized protein LOC134216383 [Armigeres subalbatus]|uniref:uncharacterized protein LOC134216383 n=1 Tax=Armigeres subalbatus TaxID=124917 RepID=UPI002ED19BBD